MTRQYYYKVDGCKADRATDPGCICWHDEGAGPLGDEARRLLNLPPPTTWRDKPAPPWTAAIMPDDALPDDSLLRQILKPTSNQSQIRSSEQARIAREQS
jgi:hypothetical protein